MLDQIEDLRAQIEAETLDSEEAAEAYRIKYLGQRNGLVTNLAKQMRDVPPENRPAVGKALNALKKLAEGRLEAAREQVQSDGRQQHLAIDLTLPGRRAFTGSAHPLTQTLQDITRFFERYGFSVKTGPEIEDDWHNFTALNFPPDHPARDMQDTFFLEEPSKEADGVVLRTHTSPVQIRTLEQEPPPVRIIAPGRVYRNEAISFKSFCLFHQVEGLYVDEGVTMGDLKQILHAFARAMFGDDVQMRFRPSFFPFTEPSAEVDIWWADASLPEGGRWLEILGCGMVDPNVLDACSIDAETYTGYAFGMGIERIAMLRYGINDIRILYENDIRFLEQF